MKDNTNIINIYIDNFLLVSNIIAIFKVLKKFFLK